MTDYISSLLNFIKHQQRRHLGFGVFIVIWSMELRNETEVAQLQIRTIILLVFWNHVKERR